MYFFLSILNYKIHQYSRYYNILFKNEGIDVHRRKWLRKRFIRDEWISRFERLQRRRLAMAFVLVSHDASADLVSIQQVLSPGKDHV